MWPQFVVELRAAVGPVFRHDARCRSQGSHLDIAHSRGPAATHGSRRILNTIFDNPADRKAGGNQTVGPLSPLNKQGGAGVPDSNPIKR